MRFISRSLAVKKSVDINFMALLKVFLYPLDISFYGRYLGTGPDSFGDLASGS